MSIFRKKEEPKAIEPITDELKEKINDAKSSLGEMLSDKKLLDTYVPNDLDEDRNSRLVVVRYFNVPTSTFYICNYRVTFKKGDMNNPTIFLRELEILKLDESKEVEHYEYINSYHKYHPYHEDWAGNIKESWDINKGYEKISTVDEGGNYDLIKSYEKKEYMDILRETAKRNSEMQLKFLVKNTKNM